MDIPDTNFHKLSHGDFILKMSSFADKVEGHPAFKDLQEHVPGAARFRDLAAQLAKAVEAAQHGDKQKAIERDDLRARAQQDFIFAVQHVVMVATFRNDPSMLNNLGLELKPNRSYSRTQNKGVPEKPTKLTVKNGKVPGMVIATVNRLHGTGGIEVHVTEADPTVEASWYSLGIFYECRMEIKGLDSVKRYYFRVRYHTTNGAGPWSAIVNLVVI